MSANIEIKARVRNWDQMHQRAADDLLDRAYVETFRRGASIVIARLKKVDALVADPVDEAVLLPDAS